MSHRIFLASLALFLTSCSPQPEAYPPPIQRVFDPNSEPNAVGEMISMEAPQADSYVVSGTITNEAGAMWRWCSEKLQMRFQPITPKGLKLFMDFVINENTFAKTGPVTMSFSIDGKPVGAVRYDQPGQKHFETPVDPSLIPGDRPVIVTAEADKYLVGETDAVHLAFLVIAAGFRP